MGEDGRGGQESEEEDRGSDMPNENQEDGKGNEAISEEGEAYREPQDTEEDGYEDIVPVDASLGHLEELLCFETWKEMLRSISIEAAYAPESYYSSPPPPEEEEKEEDILQPGSNNNSVAVEEEAQAKSISPTESGHLRPGDCSFDKQTALPSNRSNTTALMRGGPCVPPPVPCISKFQVPPFQQLPPFNLVREWGVPNRWASPPRQGPPGMSQSRGMPYRQPFFFNRGQGRGYRAFQISQPCRGNMVSHNVWRPPQNGPPKASIPPHVVGQKGGRSHKQNPPSNGGVISSQNGGGTAKREPTREAHVSKQGGSGQGSANKPTTPNNGGKVSSASRGPQSRPHHGGGRGHGRGHSRGSSSAKGPRNK